MQYNQLGDDTYGPALVAMDRISAQKLYQTISIARDSPDGVEPGDEFVVTALSDSKYLAMSITSSLVMQTITLHLNSLRHRMCVSLVREDISPQIREERAPLKHIAAALRILLTSTINCNVDSDPRVYITA